MKISSCQTQIFDPDQALRNPPNTSTTKPRDRATRPLRGCFARRVTRLTCADRGRAAVSELDFAKPTPKTGWPSGRRRWLQAPVRKGVGSNPTAVTLRDWRVCVCARPRSVNETLRAQLVLRHPAPACLCALAEQALHAAVWPSGLALAQGASPQGRGFETPQLKPYVAASSRIVGEEHVATARPCAPKEWRGVAKRVKSPDVAWRT